MPKMNELVDNVAVAISEDTGGTDKVFKDLAKKQVGKIVCG